MTATATARTPAGASGATPRAARPLEGRAGLALLVAAVVAGVTGAAAGLVGGPLWLDEAISVEIARRPVPELLAALRLDGAPPLYYLLLHGWMLVLGDGTVAVRVLTLLLLPVALLLAWRVGDRLHGRSGAVAAVTVLAALPWTMRYGSETRMYLLVVVLVLAGVLALLAVRTAGTWPAVLALGACSGALLLTHYWSLFLLAAVGLWHLPGLLRWRADALRVVAGLAVGAAVFTPWLPTFLFQAQRTGAPWAVPPDVFDLLRTPSFWGGGAVEGRVVLAVLLVQLVVLATVLLPVSRPVAGVAGTALLLAWIGAQLSEGAYTGRYTAVVVPLVAVAAGLGAAALPGRWPVVALAAVVGVGAGTGIPAAAAPRAAADRIAETFREAADPGDVLVYCPDQLGPPVAREIGPGYEQVVYPTLAGPELVDWVDYEQRNRAASPAEVADRLDQLAGERQLFVLRATGYRTYQRDGSDDCAAVTRWLEARRGTPERLISTGGSRAQVLFQFDGR
ncbi:MAG TPA: glycosyltransferase family 39 protein [Mycobacteriales bacterium]|nr:glycosyltransferase family 39 protein [Mycobacteriales bacterium]